MVKDQGAKKNKKATNTSRNVKKKTKEITTLSSEELLEQILNKKKEKQVKKSASVSSAKKSAVKKTTTKKTVKKETVDSSVLLEQILEKNKAKKQKRVERKKKKTSGRLLVDSNTVENKIVQEIIKLQEEEQKKKEDSLIITKEINLKEYLEEQKEVPPRKDFLELEEELYPTPKSKKDLVKDKIETIKKERKAKRTSKYEKEIEKKLEHRRKKEQPKPPKKQVKKSKIDYRYSKSILPGILVAAACLVLVFTVSIMLLNRTSNAVQLETIDVSSNVDLAAAKAMKEICLNTAYSTKENTEDINTYINELNGFLSKYNVSVYYYDLNRGFTYSYKAEDSYYAASVVKIIPALYIYEKAVKGEIDLDKTLTYTTNYNYDNSAYFDRSRFGTKVSLRNIIKYSLIYSDNSAYMMLVDYIGYNTLKEYGKSIGLGSYMDSDKFGHIKAHEAMNIIKKMNELFSLNTSLTNELKGYMIESDKNYLGFEDKGIKAATKYGESYPNYHEIGIVYDDNPYGIVILTRDMGKDYEKEIKEINSKIYELHRTYYANRVNSCEQSK